MTDRRIQFKVAWGLYPVGAVITPPAMLRGWLIAQGFAQPFSEAQQPQGEPIASEVEPEPEEVTQATGKRRRSKVT